MKQKSKKEPYLSTGLSFIVIFVFFLAFILIYILSNIANLSLGWFEIPPTLTLVLSLLCSLPLVIPFIWGRLTKLKFFEFEMSLSDVTAEISQTLPNELKDSKRLQLGSTLAPEVLNQVVNALKSSISSELIEVNLGYGRTWLVTRLYLLATLSDDYTEIRHVIFLENFDGRDRSYIGMAPPKTVRKCLASQYPILEKAYREAYLQCFSDREKAASPIDELEWIVQNFSTILQNLTPGDESIRNARNQSLDYKRNMKRN